MKPVILFLTGLILSNHCIYAQREADNWYFGSGAGISFANGAPVALTNGVINQDEGVATISDANGRLLFYTDGNTIWNRNHSFMANGRGLFGDNQSAQSGVIVPMPNDPNLYYVFTVSNWILTGSTNGLFYSIVDMRLDNGLGAVTTKNRLLSASPREQVSSVFHDNCKDIWIVSHEKGNTNKFLAYLLTPAGLQTTPVESNVGMNYNGNNRYGYLRFSSDGHKLCSTLGFANTVPTAVETIQLFDFDKSTGVVSNPVTLGTGMDALTRDAYSSEFSADNSKLYVVAYNKDYIYQYDLSSGNPATIAASVVNVAIGAGIKSCLQMGPDKKIYVSRSGQSWLGVIRDPDKPGALCNYVNDGVYLNGKTAALGLPNFMQGFFSLPYLGTDNSICPGATLLLNAYTRPGETYLWQDGSTNSTFTVSQAGQYWVEVNNNGCIKRDDIKIDLAPLPVVNLGNDTTICTTGTLQLDATQSTPGAAYLWQNGATTPTYIVSAAGNYSVTVTSDKGCVNTDDINVNTIAAPVVNLGNDTVICTGTNLLLDAFTAAGYTYKWQDGSINSSLTVSLPGKYRVEVNNAGCVVSDEIDVANKPLPVIYLGNDTTICTSATLLLDAAAAGGSATFAWQDGTTAASYTVTGAGDYWVKVTDNGCSKADTITVNTIAPPVVNLGNDTTICEGSRFTLDAFTAAAKAYAWQDGATTSTMQVSMPGKYWVQVSSAAACNASDTILISHKPIPDVDLGDDAFLCPNATLLLNAATMSGHALYKWQDASTASDFTVTQPGKYWVQVTENGCDNSDTIYLNAEPAISLGNDTTICLGQQLQLKPVAIPNATYLWQDGSTLPYFTTNKAGTYKVDVTTTCGMMSDIVVVKTEDCNCRVFIPNAFSPNRNFSNDVFKPVILHCNFAEYNLKIFNRWGQKIFETNNAAKGWDGTLNGHQSDVGAYVYIVTYRTGNNADRTVKHGTLMLVH